MLKSKIKSKKILIILTLFVFFAGHRIGYALDCSKMPNTVPIIQEILGLIKIIVPILIILLGSIDFVKAMVAKDDDKMKKAQTDFFIRLIIGIVIFFVPMILRFILDIAGFSDPCVNELLRF